MYGVNLRSQLPRFPQERVQHGREWNRRRVPIAKGKATFRGLLNFLLTIILAKNWAGRLACENPAHCATEKGQILGIKSRTQKLCRYFGRVSTFRQSLALQPIGPYLSESPPHIYEAKSVRSIVSNGAIEQVENLVSKLRAISYWDAEYERHRCPEWYETVAYASRRKRRSEIIRQLYKIRTRIVV